MTSRMAPAHTFPLCAAAVFNSRKVMGNVPVTKQTVAYVDGGMRVMRDKAGELYIYVR